MPKSVVFGNFSTNSGRCQESIASVPSSNLWFLGITYVKQISSEKQLSWLSFVEIALFQHHDCIRLPPPIDESNLQTVYLILRCNKDSPDFSKHKIDIPGKRIDHVLVFYIEPMWVKGPLHCLVSRNGCFDGKRGRLKRRWGRRHLKLTLRT